MQFHSVYIYIYIIWYSSRFRILRTIHTYFFYEKKKKKKKIWHSVFYEEHRLTDIAEFLWLTRPRGPSQWKLCVQTAAPNFRPAHIFCKGTYYLFASVSWSFQSWYAKICMLHKLHSPEIYFSLLMKQLCMYLNKLKQSTYCNRKFH